MHTGSQELHKKDLKRTGSISLRRSKDLSKQSSRASDSVQTFNRRSLQQALGEKKKDADKQEIITWQKKHFTDWHKKHPVNTVSVDALRAPGSNNNALGKEFMVETRCCWNITNSIEQHPTKQSQAKCSEFSWPTPDWSHLIKSA